jgi:hypothetical protein
MSKNLWVMAFVRPFHTLNYSIWAKSDENDYKSSYPRFFDIPKSSFGEHKLEIVEKKGTSLCSPNEDFGPSNNMWVSPFDTFVEMFKMEIVEK